MIADRCFFPGCSLDADHDGDHVQGWRCVQRRHPQSSFVYGLGICELAPCSAAGDALYANHERKGIVVCAAHEPALPKAIAFAQAGAA